MKKLNPTFLRGYPLALARFVTFVEENNLNSLKPKAIFSTAEVLLPNYRKIIGCIH